MRTTYPDASVGVVDSAGIVRKSSDAFARLSRQKNEYTVCFCIQALLLGEHRYENFTLRHLQKRIG